MNEIFFNQKNLMEYLDIIRELRKDVNFYYEIPKDKLDKNIYKYCLFHGLKIIHEIPKDIFDEEIVKIILDQNINNILKISKYMNEDTWSFVVENYEGTLKFVPFEFKNYFLCEKAVKKDGKNIFHVPASIIDENLCLISLEKNSNNLQYIPVRFLNQKIYSKAYENGLKLEDIPKKFRNYDIYYHSLGSEKLSLKFVPHDFRDLTMCLKALFYDKDNIKYVPDELITYEMCLWSVKENPLLIFYVPVKYRDYEMFKTAFSSQNGPKYFLFDFVQNVYLQAILRVENPEEYQIWLEENKIK